MTGLTAERLGLDDHGFIQKGKVADVVVFDPDSVTVNATYEDPRQFASGVPHVLVAGQPVVENGTHTLALPGKLLLQKQA